MIPEQQKQCRRALPMLHMHTTNGGGKNRERILGSTATAAALVRVVRSAARLYQPMSGRVLLLRSVVAHEEQASVRLQQRSVAELAKKGRNSIPC